MDLIDELQSSVLCGDGAMGTTLMEKADAPFDRCLEEFCLSAPDLVAKIHTQYIEAGARIIETNSFGANCPGWCAMVWRSASPNSTTPLPNSRARPRRAGPCMSPAASAPWA